jgi:hypothetical protein
LEDNQQEKDFFNKFFPRELIEKITTETNNYATKCIEEKLKKSFSCWLSSKVKVAPNLSLKSLTFGLRKFLDHVSSSKSDSLSEVGGVDTGDTYLFSFLVDDNSRHVYLCYKTSD